MQVRILTKQLDFCNKGHWTALLSMLSEIRNPIKVSTQQTM